MTVHCLLVGVYRHRGAYYATISTDDDKLEFVRVHFINFIDGVIRSGDKVFNFDTKKV